VTESRVLVDGARWSSSSGAAREQRVMRFSGASAATCTLRDAEAWARLQCVVHEAPGDDPGTRTATPTTRGRHASQFWSTTRVRIAEERAPIRPGSSAEPGSPATYAPR
jgi:hypothetical protein